MSAIACPSCGVAMESRSFDGRVAGGFDIDVCFPCHAMWFDQFESAQLTPTALIRLFRDINDHRNDRPRAISEQCRCPRCKVRLALTHDIQRTNKITYYRCPEGHGRLTTFFQFLREKNFVRSLTAAETAEVRAKVKQVRCSSCGGSIDLERETACSYCGAPVSILDPEAVRRTLLELDGKQRQAASVDTKRLAPNMLTPTPHPAPWTLAETSGYGGLAVDLVGAAIAFLIDQ